jgi:hypothetical protein
MDIVKFKITPKRLKSVRNSNNYIFNFNKAVEQGGQPIEDIIIETVHCIRFARKKMAVQKLYFPNQTNILDQINEVGEL